MKLKAVLLHHAHQPAKMVQPGHHTKPKMSEPYLLLMDNKQCSKTAQLKLLSWSMKTSSAIHQEFILNNPNHSLEDMLSRLLDGDSINHQDWTTGLPTTHGVHHGECKDYSGLHLDNANSTQTSSLETIPNQPLTWHTSKPLNNGLRISSTNSEEEVLSISERRFILEIFNSFMLNYIWLNLKDT